VKDAHLPYAREVETMLRGWNVRVEKDLRDEKLGKKIRDAQLQKVPYMIVLGDREVETRSLSVRERTKGDLGSLSPDSFRELLREEFSPL
jgi:threonyl-tRNA synthetase